MSKFGIRIIVVLVVYYFCTTAASITTSQPKTVLATSKGHSYNSESASVHHSNDDLVETAYVEELYRSSLLNSVYRVLRITVVFMKTALNIAIEDNPHIGHEIECKLTEIVAEVRDQVQSIVNVHISGELKCHNVKKVSDNVKQILLVQLPARIRRLISHLSEKTQDLFRETLQSGYGGVKLSLDRALSKCLSLKSIKKFNDIFCSCEILNSKCNWAGK